MRLLLAPIVMILTLPIVVPEPAFAQNSSTRVGVTIAIVESSPVEGEPLVLIRRSIVDDGSFHDVLVIERTHLHPVRVSQAIMDLLAVRTRMGDYPVTDMTLRVRHGVGRPDQPGEPRVLPWVPRVIDDLRTVGEAREIYGIGRVTAVDIYLPARGV